MDVLERRNDGADTGAGGTSVADARLMIAYASALTPGLISALAALGVRSIRLVGDRPLTAADVESSLRMEHSDAGQLASQVITRLARAENPQLTLEPVASWPASAAEWEQALSGMTLGVACVGGPVFFYEWVRELNTAAVRQRIPLTSVSVPDPSELHIGPSLYPGETACYRCYELRLKSNMDNLEEFVTFENHFKKEREAHGYGTPMPLLEATSALAARQIVEALTQPRSSKTRGKLMVVDGHGFNISFHPVLRLPRCEICTPAFQSGAPR